ncbi:MAG: hypothetical protein J6C93_06950 [Clostridia bacterium]|nr:hypothetical protein [Clostridia bacterium]
MQEFKKIADCTDERILAVSNALKESALYQFHLHYFEENGLPFFRFDKPFEREQETDPHYVSVWLDVNEREYTVSMYSHMHYSDLSEAVSAAQKLYDRTWAEVSFFLGNRKIDVVVDNLNDHEKTFESVMENVQSLLEHVSKTEGFAVGAHLHLYLSDKVHAFSIHAIEPQPIGEHQNYAAVFVCGKQTEYYVFH